MKKNCYNIIIVIPMDFTKVRNVIFFGLLAAITLYFFYIVRVFFYPLFWAAIIASIFYPVYRKLRAKIKYTNLSVVLSLLLILVIIIIPVTLLGSLLIKESIDLYGTLDSNRGHIISSASQIFEKIKNNPYASKLNFDEQFWIDKLAEASKTFGDFIFNTVKNFTQNSLIFIVMFIIMFYTMFYFLRDGERFLKKLMRLSPIGDKNEMMLYQKFASTARAAIKGTLLVGLIQGALGTILFFIVGIKGALVWGLIMVLTSIVPGLGSYIIWLPAAIIMFALGNIWQGILIIIFGALIIGTIDNILRPILVGKDTQMHPLLILFSTLGGLVVFGISGFVIGPIITALLISFWEMYEHQYRKELEKQG
ncbi:AI-2E family transporter [Patescibacteria group bacterium]|nr:MAG: AI-2E family transporter [Patescibacteria group bacterium]